MGKLVPCLILSLMLAGCQSGEQHAEVTHSASPIPSAGFSEPNFEKAALLNAELALTYLGTGNTQRAKDKLNRALRLGPHLAEVQAAHAIFYEAVGEYDFAEQYHLKSIRLGKLAGKYNNNYGAFLCRMGRYQEAKDAFLKATNDLSYTKVAETYENLGLCALEQNNHVEAKEYFTRALKQDMYRTNAILELGVMCYEAKDWVMAEYYLDLYRKRADWSPRALWLSIKLAEHQANEDSATSHWLLLKDKFPTSKEYEQLSQYYSADASS